jgi:hypothetical protein
MRQRAIIGALLLIGVGVVLGTTVFRADIAQATGLAQSVTVANTAANPVPVNVTNTSVPVHEQGTANVNLSGVARTLPAEPANAFSLSSFGGGGNVKESCSQPRPPGTRWLISSVTAANNSGSANNALLGVSPDTGFTVFGGALLVDVPAHDTVQLTFPQPYVLTNASGNPACLADVSAHGTDVTVAVVGYRD